MVWFAWATQVPGQSKQSIVVHLKHYTNDLHATMMALKLASGMQEAGAEVTLFVNLEGVRLVDRRQPQDLRWGHSAPISEVYEKFVEKGGRTLVCPHCAEAAGLNGEALRSGATIAQESEIVQMFLEADKILDY
jgi:predicted peroxiredoxin